jgi:hypothetical protein
MELYLVNIVFRIEGQAERIAQFDEQLRLIKAPSAAEAYEKAVYIGLAEEGPVNNLNGTTLNWKFVGIVGLIEIQELAGQSEIFSNTRETAVPQAYIQHVKEKQQAILLSFNQYSNGKVTV